MESIRATAPPTEKVHVLQDTAGQPKKRFTGTHLAFVSTGTGRRKPYWMTLDLYRKQDEAYVLHRIGYSVVYHALNGCEGGEEVALPDLLDITENDADPCTKCHPIPLADVRRKVDAGKGGDETVRLDRVFYTVIDLPDVPSLIHELEFVPKTSTTGKRVISRPGQLLLDQAADHDPAIAAVNEAVQDI